jgi:iron complex transport system permease protein
MRTLLLLLCLLLLGAAPFFGQIDLPWQKLWQSGTMEHQVFFELRLPRVLLAFLVGGVLSLGGLVFQVVFRNPMSTPFTLGVASGATLFTAIAIVAGLGMFSPIFAFGGAVLTVLILFAIAARFRSYDPTALLLVGIALSFFYSAALMVMFYLSTLQESYEIMRFTMGSLDVVGFGNILLLGVVSALLLWLVYHYQRPLQALLTSYTFAYLQGIDVKKLSYTLLFGVSLAVGVAVSMTGPIGFVGLIIPHILKTLYRTSADKLLWQSFFYGGAFLVLSDLIARNLAESDLPIGVVTSFVGAPFFIYLLLRRGR